MNGTALYRALVHAGAPEDEAKEAADSIASADTINNKIDVINKTIGSIQSEINDIKSEIKDIKSDMNIMKERISSVETMLKIVIGLVAGVFLLMLKMALG